MSIRAAMYTLLRTDTSVAQLVAQRDPALSGVFSAVPPQQARLPYVTVQLITADDTLYLARPGGIMSAMFQVNAWAATYNAAVEIATGIWRRLRAYRGVVGDGMSQVYIDNIERVADRDAPEGPRRGDELGVFGIQQDFIVRHAQPTL